MSKSKPTLVPSTEKLDFSPRGKRLMFASLAIAVIGLLGALALGLSAGDSYRRFFFAYLTSYCYVLAIALGGLYFVILQHLVKAGWSVSVRRIAEWIATTLPVMAVLSAPIVVAVLHYTGNLYPWASNDGYAKLNHFKQIYLHPVFFVCRLAFYFAVWTGLSLWYWQQSVKQDSNGDIRITQRMQKFAPISMILFAVTLTGAAFDLIMSLDPGWVSTIFGVYFFATGVVCVFAVIVLLVLLLQSRGYLRKSVTVEHFHDLGKLMFGFTFFWGYIAFSQYMLQWYANMPDETEWYRNRGATTAAEAIHGNQDIHCWAVVTLMLLFGCFIIPFGGLLSRHVKRNGKSLGFWAVWILVFQWFNIFWLVMPEYKHGSFEIGLIELASLVGIAGVFLAAVFYQAGRGAVRPLQDPRLLDSMAHVNV